jgi:ubiquinone/menaquinone biosynthesis C-methylase UbiE
MAHGHAHGGHRHDQHGNPDDLAGYIAKMEDPSRDAWQQPDEVLRALGVRAGQTVCDLGAGPGYFAIRLARAGARVLAVDVEPAMVAVLRDRVHAAQVNVTPVLGRPDDPLLPDAACDLVLVVNAFHHFPDGVAYLERLGRALAPGGRLVNIDFHSRELPVGPPVEHKVAREAFLPVAAAAGFTLAREETFLQYQYFLILKPR